MSELEQLRAFILQYPDRNAGEDTWIERRDRMVLEWGFDPLGKDRLSAAADAEAWGRLSLLEKRQALEAEREAAKELLSVSRTW